MNSLRSFVPKFAFAVVAALGLIGCDPGDGSAERADGLKALELRQYKKAESLLVRACELDRGNVDTLLALARTRLALGDLDGAKSVVQEALQLRADSDVKLTLAEVLYHQRDFAAAAKQFADVAGNVGEPNVMRARAFTGLGIVEMSANRNDAARVAFLCALRLDRKQNPSAFYHLGMLYRDGFDFPEAAIEQLELFARMTNAPADKVRKTLDVYLPQIRNTIAERAQQTAKASRRDSSASAAFCEKAEAAKKKGQFKTAQLRYRDALNADPLSAPAALGLAACLARDTTPSGKEKAFAAYRLACLLSPKSCSTLLEGGRRALEQNQPLTAVKLYSRAMAVNPTKTDAIDGLIRAYGRVSGAEAKAAARIYQQYRDFLKR